MSRDLILLAAALLAWGIGEGMFFNFQPLYLQQLGADPRQIGSILGGVGLAMTVVHIPAGYLSDRLGRRPLLYLAWFLGTSAAWVMALAPSLPFFVAGSVMYGLTNFVLVPLNSYITAARGTWTVGRAITIISAAFNLGAVLGPLLGGWIGNRLGMQRTFLIAALWFVLSTGLVLFIKSQPVESAESKDAGTNLRGVIKPHFARYLLLIFLVMFALYLPQPLSQNFLSNERGLDLNQIGQLLATTGIGIVVLNLLLGQLNARTGFILAQAAMAGFSIFIWKGSGMPTYFLAYFLLGSYRTARSLSIAQGRPLVQASRMGVAYGWLETVATVPILIAPPLAGLLYSLQPAMIYPVSLALLGVAILVTLVFNPIKKENQL